MLTSYFSCFVKKIFYHSIMIPSKFLTSLYKVIERIFKDLEEEEEEDLVDIKKTGKVYRAIPAFTFFGVNLGYTFWRESSLFLVEIWNMTSLDI